MIELQKTANSSPPRIVLHGGEKIGKSTFASQAFKPVFLPTEEGLKGIDTIKLVAKGKARLETFEEFEDALRYAEQNASYFDTYIVDSADWLETLIFEKVVRDSGKKSIAEAYGGYGKGYARAIDIWQSVLLKLDRINRMGKWIILICHSKSVLFNDPLTEPYDIWNMKLYSPKGQNGSLELLKEWADVIAFASAERFVNETATSKAQGDKGDKQFRAIETGRRILHLEATQAFLAGNRYGMRGDCDLTWNAFMAKLQEAFQAKK